MEPSLIRQDSHEESNTSNVILEQLSQNIFERCNYTVAVTISDGFEPASIPIDHTEPLMLLPQQSNKENRLSARLSNRQPIPSLAGKKISIQVPKETMQFTKESFMAKMASTCEEPFLHNEKAVQTEEVSGPEEADPDDQQLDEQELDSYLRNANSFLAQRDFEKLNEFLYRFKNRYKNMNQRLEYKWNALMAICKTEKKEYSDASKFYHECIDLYDTYDLQTPPTEHAKLLNSLGIVYLQLNNCKMSILAFQNSLTLLKEQREQRLFSETMNNLAVVYLKCGRIEEALEMLKECYQLKVAVYGVDSAVVISTIYNIAECYALLEQYNSAETLLKDIFKLLVRNRLVEHLPEVYRRLGTLEHMRGHHQKAKGYFDSVKHQHEWPNDLEYAHTQHQVGLLEMNKDGDRGKARRCFEEALKMYKVYADSSSEFVAKANYNLELLERGRQ